LFIISPNSPKAYNIQVIKRKKKVQSKDVTGKHILRESYYKIALGLSFGNHHFSEPGDHAFEPIPISKDYHYLIITW
jgi:hypothetical protein